MARRKKTIQDIENQRNRALQSLRQREPTIFTRWGRSNGYNLYGRSQQKAFEKFSDADKARFGNSIDFAVNKSNIRESQINRAADDAIWRLRKQGKGNKASARAQGLSAG